MNDFTTETEKAFRQNIAEFVAQSLADGPRKDAKLARPIGKTETVKWQNKLVAQGWGAPGWPKEWGGTDWSVRQRFVFEEEMATQGAPQVAGFNTRMIGSILLKYGTEAQKSRFLPRALAFQDWWCQGYSEPSSGSDLASLQTRAVRDGDHYVINGSKIWTSYAHYADWMFCLVRTDNTGKKQEGISFLLLDMTSPGVRVEQVKHFYGVHIFNQVFFEDVRVPVENLVGEEHQGWTVAKALLEHERLASARHSEAKRKLKRLIQLAKTTQLNGKPMFADSHMRQKIAGLAIDVRALEYLTMRALETYVDEGKIGFFASTMKIKGVAVNQSIDEAIFDLLGPDALPADAAYGDAELPDGFVSDAQYAAEARYFFRGPAIAGGSSEVQRSIISKQVLKL